jgi:hypothetical protein
MVGGGLDTLSLTRWHKSIPHPNMSLLGRRSRRETKRSLPEHNSWSHKLHETRMVVSVHRIIKL